MAPSLTSLPPELLHHIMQSLSIPSLLAFSATNKDNQYLALEALQRLDLAVLPRQLHNTIAFMHQSRNNCSSIHQIGKTTAIFQSGSYDEKDVTTKAIPTQDEQIAAQNTIAANILQKTSLRNLKSLTLQLYDLSSSELSSAIASNLSNLRELELKFSHPHVHDKSLSGLFWREPGRGTPAWNALAGIGEQNEKNLRMRGLQSLSIERGSLTSMQLRRFVEANSQIRKLYLNNVRGVNKDFVRWLGERCSQPGCMLEEIILENCSELFMTKEDDFQWLSCLSQNESLRCLSLSKCKNIRQDIMARILEDAEYDEWCLDEIETVIPPQGPARHYGVAKEPKQQSSVASLQSTCPRTGTVTLRASVIEVDPVYMSLPLATAA